MEAEKRGQLVPDAIASALAIFVTSGAVLRMRLRAKGLSGEVRESVCGLSSPQGHASSDLEVNSWPVGMAEVFVRTEQSRKRRPISAAMCSHG